MIERSLNLKLAVHFDPLDTWVDQPIEEIMYDVNVLFEEAFRQAMLNVGVFKRLPAKLNY